MPYRRLELDEAELKRLELSRNIYPVTALPWYQCAVPALWAWWWRHNHPGYRCAPYLLVRRMRWATEGVGDDARAGACCGLSSQ